MELRAFKFRLYPNKDQEQKLTQFFGAKRWVFNHFLFEYKQRHDREEKHLSNFDINKEITQLKKQTGTEWLKEIDDWCLKNASEDLSNAYSNFFKSISGKRKGPKVSVSRFKSKSNKQSYRTRTTTIRFHWKGSWDRHGVKRPNHPFQWNQICTSRSTASEIQTSIEKATEETSKNDQRKQVI